MFLDKYINFFDVKAYKTILQFFQKIKDLDMKLDYNIENKHKKENYILESLLKLFKINNISIRSYVMEEISEKFLKEGLKYENIIKDYIKENNLYCDIVNNKLVYNNLYKKFENKNKTVFILKTLKDGRLLTILSERIIIFNKNNFSIDL